MGLVNKVNDLENRIANCKIEISINNDTLKELNEKDGMLALIEKRDCVTALKELYRDLNVLTHEWQTIKKSEDYAHELYRAN